MVAQDYRHVLSVFIKPAKGIEIIRAAVNKIPHGPQPIIVLIKTHLFQQALKGFKAPLNVTDGVRCHGLLIPRLLASPQLRERNKLLYLEKLGAITRIDTQRV